jgi:hypothetical protein
MCREAAFGGNCVKREDYLVDVNVDGSILLGENFKAVHEHYLKAHDEVKVLFRSFLISLLHGANDLRRAICSLYPEIKFAVFFEWELCWEPEPIRTI